MKLRLRLKLRLSLNPFSLYLHVLKRMSIVIYLTKIEKFNAAHKMWVDDWSEDENFEVFGKCANANWHGHNYALHVTVKGEADPQTGFILNAQELSRIMKREVIDKMDHRNLNLDVDFIPKTMQPTSENLVYLIWQQLEPHLSGVKLHRILLWETDTIYAEYYGPN